MRDVPAELVTAGALGKVLLEARTPRVTVDGTRIRVKSYPSMAIRFHVKSEPV